MQEKSHNFHNNFLQLLPATITSFNIFLFLPKKMCILDLFYKFYGVLIWNLATLNVRNYLFQIFQKYISTFATFSSRNNLCLYKSIFIKKRSSLDFWTRNAQNEKFWVKISYFAFWFWNQHIQISPYICMFSWKMEHF